MAIAQKPIHSPEFQADFCSTWNKGGGYVELCNSRSISKDFYRLIYKDFDTIVGLAQRDAGFLSDLSTLEKAFCKTAIKIFCGAPAGYRDGNVKTEKDKKRYFQFSSEYYAVAKKQYPEILKRRPILRQFFNRLDYVDRISKIIFQAVLNSMEKIHPNIRTIVYGKRHSLTVITKVLCYEASPKDLGTSPHYDKSALSLILDNDDPGKGNLVLSAQHHPFDFKRLPTPKGAHLSHSKGSSALCIPGSLLKASGITIATTACAVLPFHGLYTQSLLLP